MKYIRTTKGIYNTRKNIYYFNNGTYFYQIGKDCFGIFNAEIIKQADTIEELCDEFISIHTLDSGTTIKSLVRKKYRGALKQQVINSPRYYQGFGAIWTDKGLIYVAKMNEEGALELL